MPRQTLLDAGVSEDTLNRVLQAIERETIAVFEEYDVEIDDREAVISVVQETILEMVVEIGEGLDCTVAEQFEELAADFEGSGSAGRSNIIFAIGRAWRRDDAPPALRELSGAVLARNYSRADI